MQFDRLCRYLERSFTVGSVESVIAGLRVCGAITDTHNWPQRCPQLAQLALERMKDPVWLPSYWRYCCFARARMIGDPIGEARMIAAWAVIDTIKVLARQSK